MQALSACGPGSLAQPYNRRRLHETTPLEDEKPRELHPGLPTFASLSMAGSACVEWDNSDWPMHVSITPKFFNQEFLNEINFEAVKYEIENYIWIYLKYKVAIDSGNSHIDFVRQSLAATC